MTRIDEVDKKVTDGFASVVNRLNAVEGQVRLLHLENEKLKEELENRTNRQLRRTLIFKNIPESKDDESYQEVKTLLAETISSCTDIPKQEALDGIERAHREAKREGGSRQGRRRIFAAFLNWELPQKILNGFKKRCIDDRAFDIYVDQMYGPLTSLRRNLAFQERKSLKDKGTIVSGYVDFPARLMVNFPGEVDRYGKKVYKLHTNFSDNKVERR